MMFRLSLFLVGLCGFIALSYEILWARVYSFITQGRAHSFGEMLGAYLAGLAIGAWYSIRHQDRESGHDPAHLGALSTFVLLANVIGFLLIPIISWVALKYSYGFTLPLMAIVAALLGATFPLICHFAIPPDDRAGAGLSYLYLSNILGSTAGSLLTGFVLMDHLTLQQMSVVLAVLGLLLAAGLTFPAGLSRSLRSRRLIVSGVAAVAVVASAPFLFEGVYERMQFKTEYESKKKWLPFATVVETKSGVITVDRDGSIYGGGAYDGKMWTDLRKSDWLIRPYTVSAFHSGEELDVLMVGLSGGSWANILLGNPRVKHLTVIEINRGYVEVVKRYDSVKSILDNPRMTLVIDDGRRWLRRNPDRKFDAIVCNTTHNWRSFASNLLSMEYLALVKSHLRPEGIYLYNATGSRQAERTAIESFEYTMMVLNNIVGSDSPLVFDKARWAGIMRDYTIDGKRCFDFDKAEDRELYEYTMRLADTLDKDVDTQIRLTSQKVIAERSKDATIITDDNMATEWFR